jgi:uncharacterized membrane protein YgaE (UPF0421/DUF939 family)
VTWRAFSAQSLKAAVAAGLAWLIVLPLGGVADAYPYYAPLGAVIAVSSTVAGSLRSSIQAVVSIAIGAAIAVGVMLVTELPAAIDIVLVVLIGSPVTGWRVFGSQASYAPISGLFVLIIGQDDPLAMATAYTGLAALGATVGIVLNALLPPLALNPVTSSIRHLREVLADQLDDLAEGLLSEDRLTPAQWAERQREIRPNTEHLQQVVAHATESRRANWRAKRWSQTAERRYEQARALQQVAYLIEDITALVTEQEHADRELVALGPRLRPHAAHALQDLARTLRSVEAETAEEDELREADASVNKLADEIRDERHRTEHDLFTAGTIVAGVRRVMASLTPDDLRDEMPSDW